MIDLSAVELAIVGGLITLLVGLLGMLYNIFNNRINELSKKIDTLTTTILQQSSVYATKSSMRRAFKKIDSLHGRIIVLSAAVLGKKKAIEELEDDFFSEDVGEE